MTAARRAALLLITAVELVIFLDTTVVNIALPTIGHALDLGEAGLGWVANAYLLAFGGFMLAGGRAADRLGPRRVFRTGLAAFTLASAVAGLAPNAAVLIAARAAQGIGAAVVVPAELALLTATFTEPAAHRRAFGVWSAMGASGALIGTAAGGPLAQWLGWPSIFLINLPVGVLALAFSGRLLPADPARTAGPARGLDLPGAALGTTGLLLLGYAIGALSWPLAVAAVALLAAFVAVEARQPAPMLPLRLLRVPRVAGSAVISGLVGASHVAAFALLALYFQNSQGYGAVRSGLAVLPVAAVSVVASRTLVPPAMRRLGATGVLVAGLAAETLALAWFARLPAHGSYLADVLPGAVLLGIGLPAAFVGVTVPAVTAVPTADTGVTGAIVNTAQRIGSGLGVSTLLLLAASLTLATSYVTGLRAAFAAAGLLAAIGCALSLALHRSVHSGQQAPARS